MANGIDFSSVEVRHSDDLMALQAAALEATANAVVITDHKGTVIWVNSAFEQLTGYSCQEIVGKSTRLLKSGKTPQKVYDELWATVLAGRIWRGEVINRRKDGSLYHEEMTITPVRNHEGETTNYIAIKQDITERKKAEEEMWKMEESIRGVGLMAELLQSCMSLTEAAGVISSAGRKLFPSFSGVVFLFNASRHHLESAACWGRDCPEEKAFSPDDCWALRRGRLHVWENEMTVRCGHFGAESRLPSLCVPLIAQGEAFGIVCLMAEASDSLAAPRAISKSEVQLAVSMAEQAATALANINVRERLRTEATRDPLTGLFNRRYLDEFMERQVSDAIRKRRPMGIIMLDVDRFKVFNDTFGHEAGDRILKALGEYLIKFVRRGDLACRYGGEEFALVLPDALLEDTCRRAEELRAAVHQITVAHGNTILRGLTISLGVAAFPEHGRTAPHLLGAADAALLRAKEGGRDRVFVSQVTQCAESA